MEAASGMENLRSSSAMPCFATILIALLLAVPAMSVELFRYRGAAKDGGTLEYVFEGSSLRLLWREGPVRNSEHSTTLAASGAECGFGVAQKVSHRSNRRSGHGTRLNDL